MPGALRLYRALATASIRGQLQYRASVTMAAVGTFIAMAAETAGVWALFDRFGEIGGWTLPQGALLYGMIAVAYSLCDIVGRGFDQFGSTIRAGDFDRVLLRPRSTVLQLLAQDVVLRRLGRLTQGLIVLGYAIAAGAVDWTIARAALLVGAIACGACAFLGLIVLQATTAFWTVQSLEVWNAFTYGGLMASRYPLPIYRRWFRALFTYVFPLACVSFFPASTILGIGEPLGAPEIVGWLAPLAGPVFLILSLRVWRFGIHHYRSTGS